MIVMCAPFSATSFTLPLLQCWQFAPLCSVILCLLPYVSELSAGGVRGFFIGGVK